MPWGAIIGGAISYIGAQDAAGSYSDAADRSANATKFSPYNVYSGFGSGAFSPARAGTAGRPGYWSGGTSDNAAANGGQTGRSGGGYQGIDRKSVV